MRVNMRLAVTIKTKYVAHHWMNVTDSRNTGLYNYVGFPTW